MKMMATTPVCRSRRDTVLLLALTVATTLAAGLTGGGWVYGFIVGACGGTLLLAAIDRLRHRRTTGPPAHAADDTPVVPGDHPAPTPRG